MSIVGTRILEKLRPSGVSYGLTYYFQLTHYRFISKKKSKIVIFLSGITFSTKLRSLSSNIFLESLFKEAPNDHTVAYMNIDSSLSGSGRFYMLSKESRIRVSCMITLRLVRGSVN